MPSTISQFDAFLKNYFNPQKVEDLTRAGKPFFGRIKKNEDVSGDQWNVPILWSNPQGLSGGSLANAQTATGNIKGDKWAILMGDYFGTVSIGDKVIMASRNNAGAFLDNKTTEIEGLYEAFSNDLALYLFRNGGGSTGRINATYVSGNVIGLADPRDTFNFEVNEYVQASAGDGTGASDAARAGNTFITGVDAVNGTITLSNAAGITGLAANDFLFRLGNIASGGTGALIMHGVQAYITATSAPAALWGVTRSTQVQRLSGCKVATADVNGKGIEERIQLLGAYMAGRFRAMTSGGSYECYLHPEDWQTLTISVQTRGIRPLEESDTKFGYEYIDVIAGGKRMKVFADPYCPKGNAFILRMDNWVLGSYGQLVRTLNGDGLTMLRAATTNSFEYRLQGYPEVSCNAPGFSGFVPMPL
jgi:hypothetical protein